MKNNKLIIRGLVRNNKGQPLAGLRIEVWDKDLLFDDFLAEAITGRNGGFTLPLEPERFRELFADRKPDLYFRVYAKDLLILSTETTVLWNIDSRLESVLLVVDTEESNFTGDSEPDGKRERLEISGRLTDSNGVALKGNRIEVLIKSIGSEELAGITSTGNQGNYSQVIETADNGDLPDIIVRAFQSGSASEVIASATRYNVSGKTVIDLIAPAAQIKTASEYQSVNVDLQSFLGNMEINQLAEDEENEQITYLANKSGYDARLIAMNVAAQQLGASLKIAPAHLYAMFRAGIAGNADAIRSVSVETAKTAIENAIEQNIIPPDDKLDDTLQMLNTHAVNFVLDYKPEKALFSMGEMLNLRLNDQQKQTFAGVYKMSGEDTSKLWSGLAEKGLGESTIRQLQLDGKLGFLTGQNLPLIERIYKVHKIGSETELASKGLYKSEAWKEIIGNDTPPDITADEYATYLASQVKISYPNAVAAAMIMNEEITLGSNVPKEELHQFLNSNGQKKTIGTDPVKQWDGFQNLSTQAKAAAKTFERLYQMSPSDKALTTLSNLGITSAYQIAAYPESHFLAKHGASFSSQTEAMQVYKKAGEIYSASLNIAVGYLTQRAAPNVYAITGNLSRVPSETIAYPTLEELFGNMDYCSCDHCKSVLSPAAYLVELLEFIDLSDVPHNKTNPADVLKSRRPDIENIQLSCENTNKALPYIDLVNEILEYYILHGNLDNLQGHDVTEEISQAELLAEPQFVQKAVYEISPTGNDLRSKVFPYNLPFHQPLETLRRIFNLWGVSLEKCLRVFSTPLSARKEVLGLSEDEYKTLTNIQYRKLPLYFGEPENNTLAQLNAAIANAKEFSRRVGINYDDLVQLLKTWFINPGYGLTPKLQRLGISLMNIQRYYNEEINVTVLEALASNTIDIDDYGGNIGEWLHANRDLIMMLITLTEVGEPGDDCNFAQFELRFALPDNVHNQLTATAYHKLHRFLRLQRKTGWNTELLDAVIKPLLPVHPLLISMDNLDEVFMILLDRMANFVSLASLLGLSVKKYPDLLRVMDSSIALPLRREQLARLLKMNPAEMLQLSELTGIDPLAADPETDEPSIIRFVTIAKSLKANSVKTSDLAYLLQHSDPSGKLAPATDKLLKNIKLMKEALNLVDAENKIAPDNADFALARSKMQLVYDAETTNIFFGFLLNTNTYSEPFATSLEELPQPLKDASARLGYDAFRKELTYTGVLSAIDQASIENAANNLTIAELPAGSTPADLAAFQAGFLSALQALFVRSNASFNEFSAGYPELRTVYDDVMAESTPASQVQKLIGSLLPGLITSLKKVALKQVLSGILKAPAELVEVLTGNKEVIHAASNAASGVMYDFEQLQLPLEFDQNMSYRFYLDVPATDDYLIYFSAPQNTVVSLRIEEQDIINTVIGASGEVNGACTLKGGQLHPVIMTIGSLPAGTVLNLMWRSKTLAKTMVPVTMIYPEDQVNSAIESLVRLEKSVQFIKVLKLTVPEVAYFAEVNAGTGGFLNELPVASGISAAGLASLWGKTELLNYFLSLKKENEPEENTWLSVLQNPGIKNAQNKFLLEGFNMWQEPDVTEVLNRFGLTRSGLSDLNNLRKVMEAMNLITAIGYPAVQSLNWMTGDPGYDLVAGIKATLKENLSNAAWTESMQSVNDVVRNQLRDALVSFILQYKRPSPEIITPDKLYEYLLVDVQMDACMKTSRIRLALSSVQLFIQRCLLNLEPEVSPSSIREDHWAWMKRYRVWEANRKVFLYPENWLEPELRDNKSGFFKELEGEMMQQEITDESAELAFLNYLKKLDDIARLEIVGMYLEENNNVNQDDDILHVIGRTIGITRQFYYRRYEYGYWTPWEKISLNIEGDHVFPVIWKKRLFIFWLNVAEKPVTKNAIDIPSGASVKDKVLLNVEINMCWGEYYKGKWTSPKSGELNRPLMIENLESFDKSQLILLCRKERKEHPAGKFRERLIFDIQYGDLYKITGRGYYGYGGTLVFTSKNAPPYIQKYQHDTELTEQVARFNRTTLIKTESATFPDNNRIVNEGRDFNLNVIQPFGAKAKEIKENLFSKKEPLTTGFNVLPLNHPVSNQFEAPVSYTDERSTLFVQPSEAIEYVSDFNGYYPYFPDKPLIIIPPILREPVPKWPPFDAPLPRPGDILGNPWQEVIDPVAVGNNINILVSGTETFKFGNTLFGPSGKIADTQSSF